MKNLIKKIEEANIAYRKGKPIMTDNEFDSLLEELKSQDPNNPLLEKSVLGNSPKGSRKQKLPIPMFSLNKVKSIQELRDWLISNQIGVGELLVITPKYDGISLCVDEASEEFDCWTRGDGVEGQKSNKHFHKAKKYSSKSFQESIRNMVPHMYTFGEAIMSKENFKKHMDKYANARNMVAGLFNKNIPSGELKDIDFMRYGIHDLNCSKLEQLEKLNEYNHKNVDSFILSAADILNSKEEDLLKVFNTLFNRFGAYYQIDGLVFDINNSTLRSKLGREENMNPRYARALKLPEWSEKAITKVTGIRWKVSKQGKLKPVINIEPVELGGVTISNVSGYNAKYIFDNEIHNSAKIEICRSGDVIPKHLRTIKSDKNTLEELMDKMAICPCCGSQTKWDETYTELICDNPTCKEKRIGKLCHFFGVIGIEDFGEPTVKKLYNAGFKTYNDIITIPKEELVQIEGIGLKNSERLLKSFKKVFNDGLPFAKFLHALDVFEGKIGEKICQNILNKFGENYFRNQIYDYLEIDGVSEITAKIFRQGCTKFVNMCIPDIPITYYEEPKSEQESDICKNWVVCMTGFRDKRVEERIKSNGGSMCGGVSKKTTHLIVKAMSSASSKMKKAKEMGINIMSASEAFEYLGIN